jgi:hypothetical protein
VRSPGFGPGFLPWQGNVLDHSSAMHTETVPLARLDYDRTAEQLIINTLIYLKDKGYQLVRTINETTAIYKKRKGT